jgi:ribosomal protein S18 acetylase RimI-like enzyme
MISSTVTNDRNDMVNIRNADPKKDFKVISEIYVKAFYEQVQFRWVFQTDGEAHKGALRVFFDGRLYLLRAYKETYLIVAEKGEEVIGACGIEPNSCKFTLYDWICAGVLMVPLFYGYASLTRLLQLGDELAKDDIPDPRGGKLVMMAVDPKYQGQGIGSKIVKEIIRKWDSDSGGDLRLTTQVESNVKFYKNYGFEVTEEKVCDGFTNWSMRRKKPDAASTSTAAPTTIAAAAATTTAVGISIATDSQVK